jgi:hypothetical protein
MELLLNEDFEVVHVQLPSDPHRMGRVGEEWLEELDTAMRGAKCSMERST